VLLLWPRVCRELGIVDRYVHVYSFKTFFVLQEFP